MIVSVITKWTLHVSKIFVAQLSKHYLLQKMYIIYSNLTEKDNFYFTQTY